ncbi:MAG: thiamine pyrophosphate-dependent enzyme [Candidatus Aminicenantaceae bacterium]
MQDKILLGDEAVALAAVHAGLTAGYSYPGTPASEIMEYLIRIKGKEGSHQARWCVNEKVAYEEALGVSYAGKRALVSMKHVGLNVAADPFMNSAVTRINGGLVVAAADDPGMHSSQNEQDSRYFADFAQVICLEPSSHQEAYDMTRKAFEISERLHIPVMIRLVTRLAHSRSRFNPAPAEEQNPLHLPESRDWTLLPVNARRRFKELTDSQPEHLKLSEESDFNQIRINHKNRSLGVITSGIGYNYVMETFPGENERPSLLKISTYPVPENLIRRLVEHVETIMVVEEGYPFIERRIRGLFGIPGKIILGKLSGHLPLTGELNPDVVARAAHVSEKKPEEKPPDIPFRPPQLCRGCPHIDTFKAVKAALEDYSQAVVFSDIGCYTLGALPPYQAVDTCVCMGASVRMAKGGAEAGIHPSVGVIGDSTFAHSGITPLLDAAAADSDMTLIIVDNASVAMTGGQPTFATGEFLRRLAAGVGVDEKHIRIMTPLAKNHQDNIRLLKEEIEHRGLSVIISSRECIQQARRRKKGDR